MTPYYNHEGVTIYHGDCRDVFWGLQPADLLLTDPPYGVNLGNHLGASDGRTDHVLVKGLYESYDDTLDNLRSLIVPRVRLALSLCVRGIVFCAGQHIGEFPKPNVVGAYTSQPRKGATLGASRPLLPRCSTAPVVAWNWAPRRLYFHPPPHPKRMVTRARNRSMR